MICRKARGTSAVRLGLLFAGLCLLLSASGFRAQDQDPGWPRDIQASQGTITLYQPQPESLLGNILSGRAATSYLKNGETKPVFGVVWFHGRLSVDRDNRNAELTEVQLTRVRFPEATPDQEQKYIDIVQPVVTGWPSHPISMDRLMTSLAASEQEVKSEDALRNDPPKILIADGPAVLVLYDGPPALRDIPDTKLQRVVNTPYPVIFDPATKTYYLTNTTWWYGAGDPMGPWTLGATAPPEVVAVIPRDAKGQASDDQSPALSNSPPKVFTATEPTELIWTDGKPDWRPVGSAGDLLYVENTDGNIFLDVKSKATYLLISGRWYTGASLQGPWTFAKPTDLPVSFSTIPPASAKGPARASVPGTEESKDALMDTQIPQTAAVKRGPAADVTTSFDGNAQFKAVSGTNLEYAVNTSQQILRQNGQYFLCKDGIWYGSSSASGPWSVSDKRPDGVSDIPASNPLYNTKYVQVYTSTPDVVYVGYTPGYMGAYPYYGTVVYGTGWYYPGWVGSYYYPWAATWGWGAYYNPWYGWGMGSGFGWGFAWGFAWGAAWNHWGWGGGCWGPCGIYNNVRINNINIGRANISGNWPGKPGNRPGQGGQPGGKPGQLPANNLYNRGNNPNMKASADQRQKAMQDIKSRPNFAQGKANSVFAGKDGSVYRKTDGGWQQRGQNGGWNKAGEGGQGKDRTGGGIGGGQGTSTRPGTYDRPGGGGSGMQGLNNDWQARQRGAMQTQNFNRGGWGGGAGGGFGGGGFGGGGGYRGGGFSGGGGGRRR